jgi:predicted amidohydrolase
MPKEADPFGDAFSLDAARACSRERTDAHAAVLARAGEAGADIAVTGEDIAAISSAATYLDDPSIFRTLVPETADYSLEALGRVARTHHMHIVACFYEPDGDRIVNSAVLFGRDGEVIGRYYKVHLPVYETWQVAAGDAFPAFETDIGMVGMLICYDQMWPEATAACALNGARIICHPSAATLAAYQMQARAMDYQVFYVSGTGRGSRIVAPNAKLLADAGEENDVFITADVHIETASLAPEGFWETIYSGIRDHRERHLKLRRADAYGVLLDPNPPALRAYPSGGVANTPEKIQEVYESQRTEYRRWRAGEPARYHWRWSDEQDQD